MSISYWLDSKSAKKPKSYDIAIVGGGITGLSISYWLKKEDPSLKVAILEKGDLAAGASGRNAGFITCGSVEHFNRMVSKHGEKQALEIWQFAETNLNLLQEHIIQGSPESVEFLQRGAYSLAAKDVEFQELQSVAKIMDRNKIPVEVYNSAAIAKNVGAQGFVGGIKYCQDGEVHPVRLIEKILAKTDVDFFPRTEVFSVSDNGDGTRKLSTQNGQFEAPIVIYAMNGYSSILNPYFKDKIYPTRGQMLMMEPVEQFMDGPCYANFYLDYFRQMATGELLIGGFRQLEKETEVGFSDHITDVIQDSLHEFVEEHLPQFKNKKVTHRWAGIMGFSQDGEPMIGSLPEDNQSFFAGGFTGHGIGLAFHTAKCLVDLMFDRKVPGWLSSRRFS